MKQLNITILLTMLMSMVGVQIFAHDAEVDGIYYLLDSSSKTATVTYKGSSSSEYSNEYTGSVVIPEMVTYENKTYSVTSIGEKAFSDCSNLTSVIISESVTSIGHYAFFWCTGLTSIIIPNSVTSIGERVFSSCSGLTSVTIPNSVTSIGRNAFYGTAWYNNQPDGVVYAGKVAYTYKGTMPDNTSITIKDGTLGIAGSAFYDCSKLTSITIPNSVTIIGPSAFSGTTWYNNQPDGVVYAGKVAYTYKGTMPDNTSITIKEGTLGIAVNAFSGCTGLKSITIPNSVTSIGEYAFYYCPGLTSIIVASGNNKYDSRDNCNAIIETASNTLINGCMSTTIPNSVTSIGDDAFYWCTGLTSITIPNSVTSIGHYAFLCCKGLTSIIIPNSVTNIGKYAFSGCSGLTAIYSYIENPTSSTGANFDSSNYSNATLYVPYGTKDKYLATDGWKNFANIVEMEPTPEPSSDNTLAISNAETYAGKQVVLPIDMNNVASIKAFQFDLYLPEGVTIAKDEENEDMIDLTGRAAKSHTVAYSKQADGAIRMVCTSMSGAAFKGNDGAIMNITLNVAPDMAEGDYDIEIKKIELSDGTPYNPADIKATLTVKTYTPGDVDGTGTVSVNDAVCVINYILGSPAEDFIEPAADLDGNGVITVNDVVILINDYILGGNSQNSLDINLMQETADEDYLYIEEDLENMVAGETREVEVHMNTNRTDIQGLQCDIFLPDGMEFVPEEDGDEKYYADKGGRAAKSHSVAARIQPDGALRVVETSTSGAKFKDNDQAVFYFTVKAKENMVAGNYEIKLANMELSYGGTPINPSDRTAKVVITDPSAINGINAEDAKSFVGKFIKDNKIIIMKNGKKHSVSGQGM